MIFRLIFSMFLVTAAFAAEPPPNFVFEPKTVAPGGSVTITGWLFSPASTSVGISVVDGDGQRTALGPAALRGGGFSKTFAIPPDLAPGFYQLLKKNLKHWLLSKAHRCLRLSSIS